MTTPQDEIAKLRWYLDHIRAWCEHELNYGCPEGTLKGVLETVRDTARRGLKTPRASKIDLCGINPHAETDALGEKEEDGLHG